MVFPVQNRKGFTLVELLVVIAILAVLAALILPQMAQFNRSQALSDSASALQTALRSAQNNASSGTRCNSSDQTATWYLHFLNHTQYEIGSTCSSLTATPAALISYALSGGVSFAGIDLSPYSNQDYCYTDWTATDSTAPNFKVVFNNISTEANIQGPTGCVGYDKRMKIVLQMDADPSKQVNVIVEKGGAIYVSSN